MKVSEGSMSFIDKYIEESDTQIISWMNIAGYQKSGKTTTLIELLKHVPGVLVDFEKGTKAYKGKFIKIGENNLKMFFDFIEDCKRNRDHGIEILVLDPFTKLVSMYTDHLMVKYNVSNLSDKKIAGVGNGWTILYQRFYKLMSDLWELFPLVLTVSHLKLDNNFTDSKAVKIADLDLVGKLKNFVHREVDAHMVFTGGKDDEGSFITKVNDDSNSEIIQVPLGHRRYDFIENIRTNEDFIVEIAKLFDIQLEKKDLFKETKANITLRKLTKEKTDEIYSR